MRPAECSREETATSPWDAIIIGGGVAGGSAACRCADAGLRTLLIERSAMPRSKVCGCCLTPAGVDSLARANLSRVLDGSPTLTRMTLRFGPREARFEIPPYRVVSRESMDASLLEAAAARGVRVVTHAAARVTAEHAVRLTRDGDSIACRAKVILACDGLAGTSLRDLSEFEWTIAPASRMGLGANLPADAADLGEGELRMLCGPAGYLGLVRLADGSIDAAAAIDPSVVRLAASAGQAAASLCGDAGVDLAALHDATWSGTPLLTRSRRVVARGKVLAVGDAAGYVEPFTGEGMTWALRGAEAAATLAARIAAGEGSASEWRDIHASIVAERQRHCGLIASALRHPSVMRGLLTAGSLFPRAFSVAAKIAVGGVS
jgi:menaquinone-9 beta-reductase